MKLIHISDIHLTLPGEPMDGLDPHARLDRALTHVAAHHGDADRVIITGDLTHWGEAGAYHALRDRIAGVALPVRLLIGNHDDRDTFRAVFPDAPTDANGYINSAETLDDIRLIYLDSTAPRTHAGHFCAERRTWLEAELRDAPRARLFLHHNPMPVHLPAADRIGMNADDRAGLLDLLGRYSDRIDYIHFGHVHAAITGTVQGIPFSCVPSTCNQSFPDLSEPTWLQGGPMAPAYGVILSDGRDTVIHHIPFAWDGPLRRAGTGWEDWAKPKAS